MSERQCMQQFLLVAAVALLAVICCCHAYPSSLTLPRNENFMRRRSLQDCTKSAVLRMTCERCAKDSRSDDAFIMCCSNETGIRDWCEEFLAFGSDDRLMQHKRWAV